MDENQYDSLIEKIATMMEKDELSADEQNAQKLQKYNDHVKSNSNLNDEDAMKASLRIIALFKIKKFGFW